MTAINAVWELTQKLKSTRAKIENLRDALQNITPTLNGLPKSQSVDDRLSKLLSLKLDAEKELAELEIELVEMKAGLTTEIISSTLDDVKKKILLLRYVHLKPFAEICAKVGYSEPHIFCLHKIAVKKFTQN